MNPIRSIKLFRHLGADCALAHPGSRFGEKDIVGVCDIPASVTDAEVVRRAQKTIIARERQPKYPTCSDPTLSKSIWYKFDELSDGQSIRILPS